MPIILSPDFAGSDIVYFDPSDEATGTEVTFTLSDTATYLLTEFTRPSSFQSVWAGSISTEGERRAAGKPENRRLVLKWDVTASTRAGLEAAVSPLTEKAAKFAREGGTLRFESGSGEIRTYDIEALEGFDVPFDVNYGLGVAQVTMNLTARPYSRGEAVTYGPFSETTDPALIFDVADVPGDVEALGELIVSTDVSGGTFQRTMIWGSETATATGTSRHDTLTEPLLYEAESLTLANGTAATVVAGSSGGSVARQAALTTSFGEYVQYDGEIVGTFRLLVRMWVPATNTGTVQVRADWRVAGNSSSVTNTAVTIDPAWEGTWRLMDLGMITATAEPELTGSATGQVTVILEATSSVNGDDVDFDYLLFVPVTSGYGHISDAIGQIGPAITNPELGSVQVRHDAVYANTSNGYGVPRRYSGDFLTVAPGAEGISSRFVVLFSRGLLEEEADSSIDDLSATLVVTPRYLV